MTLRTVAVKDPQQQAPGMAFRARDRRLRQRTQTIDAWPGHLAAFGLIAPKATVHLQRLRAFMIAPQVDLPNEVIEIAQMLLDQIDGQQAQIIALEVRLRARAPQDEASARLMTIPGVGPICAAAVAAFSAPMESFPKGRDFAAWLGLTPRQHSTGGKVILGRMSKMGQRDIRRLLITGAMPVVRWAVIRGANDPGCERFGACRTFEAQTAHGCGGGAGQQIGEDDLGALDQRGNLYQRPYQLTSAQDREVMEAIALGSFAKKFHALQQASTPQQRCTRVLP